MSKVWIEQQNLGNDLHNFLDAEFDDTSKMSLARRINSRAAVVVESALGTTTRHKETIWPLRGWKVHL